MRKLQDFHHLFDGLCKQSIAYTSIHDSINDQSIVFGNVRQENIAHYMVRLLSLAVVGLLHEMIVV